MSTTLPVLPLRNFVMFPGLLTAIQTNDPYVALLLQEIEKHSKQFVVSLMIKEEEYFYQTATVVQLEDVSTEMPGMFTLTVRGITKFFVEDCPVLQPLIMAKGKILKDYYMEEESGHVQGVELAKMLKRYIFLSQPHPEAMLQAVSFIADPDILCNFCVHYFMDNPHEKQDFLQMLNINKRMAKVKTFVEGKLAEQMSKHAPGMVY